MAFLEFLLAFFSYTVKMLKSEKLMIAQSKHIIIAQGQLKCISVIQRKSDFDLIVLCDIYEKIYLSSVFQSVQF